MHQFSIITPTFNRAKYLPRVYDSLCLQGDVDFEWIIVDDGSSDNTKEVVSGFNKIFEIKYFYQENKGKPTAVNFGIQMADSHISIYFDDDDIFCLNTLKKVWNYYDIQTGKFEHDCVAVSGLCQYDSGEIIGDKYPQEYYISDRIHYRSNNNIRGDKCEFHITEILKKYPYPIFEDEKNIIPGIIYNRIGLLYKTIYVNQIFSVKQFLQGGLSDQNYEQKYPLGSELFYNEASIPPFNLKQQIQNSGIYIFYARINRRKNIFAHAMNKKIFALGFCYSSIHKCKLFLRSFPFFQKIKNILKSYIAKPTKKAVYLKKINRNNII